MNKQGLEPTPYWEKVWAELAPKLGDRNIYYLEVSKNRFLYFLPDGNEIVDITRQCAASGSGAWFLFDNYHYYSTDLKPHQLKYHLYYKLGLKNEVLALTEGQ